MTLPVLTSFVGGQWLSSEGRPVITRENPANAAEVTVRWCPATADEVRTAVDAAQAAWPNWSAIPLGKRIELLSQLLAQVETQADVLARLITAENGKSLTDARSEIAGGLGDAHHSLHQARHLSDREPASTADASVHSELILEPLGVCLLITPWNFPFATILRKLVPALLYGNTAVVKPSELTPGPAGLLFSILAALPFPAGTVSLILGTGHEIGPILASHPAVAAISFTGSNAAGQSLTRITADRNVRLQLEMGGKNSLVVLADADIDEAVEAAITGGFSCAGQWCTGTGRVIVDQTIIAEFSDKLVARAANLSIGPVITASRVQFARDAIHTAVAAGARLRCGGQTLPGGHFITPAVLEDVTETMAAFIDELFVPVLPVVAARDADDAVRLANLGHYGLSAAVFSRDIEKGAALARRIEAGIIHVNLHTAYREPALPVSGWRESGRGLPECGRFARDFFTRPRAFYRQQS